MISTEAHACGRVKIVPYEVARSNMCPNITDCILAVVDSRVSWVDVSSGCSFDNGSSSLSVPRHLVVPDLNFTGTVIVLGRGTQDVGVQERLEVLIGVPNEMCPMGH